MDAPDITGERKTWHKITLDFEGPQRSENAETFLDFRLNVTFTNAQTGETITVPGYFAADGDAANTNATSGNIWRAHFTPPSDGTWTYEASFRTGNDIAVSLNENAGTPVSSIDGSKGAFDVSASDKTGVDWRAKGALEYVGDQYLETAADGENFIKSGVGSPENFLAYSGFDNTPDTHDYSPHLQDWNVGDPTWDGGKGREIIGAVNYLADEGVNSFYFMPMTVAGDGRDVWPWAASDLASINKNASAPSGFNADARVFDVSKLAQWEIVFEHMQEKGIALHMFLQETENDQLLNGGALGLERQLYIRELVARFGHHNGLIYNLGEENSNTTGELRDHSAYLQALDGYDRAIELHTFPGQKSQKFGPLTGSDTIDGFSLQSSPGTIRDDTEQWISESKQDGRAIPAFWDEQAPAQVGLDTDADPAQQKQVREALWGHLTAGGSGAEWYYGYGTGQTDLNLEDFRSRDAAYDWAKAARELFEELPLEQMSMADGLTSNTTGADFVMADPGEIYVAYLPDGGSASLDLSGEAGDFEVWWYDPRNGGVLQEGSVSSVSGGAARSLGNPPSQSGQDWTIVVRKAGAYDLGEVEPADSNNGGGGGTPPVDGEGYFEGVGSGNAFRFKIQIEDENGENAGETPGGDWSFIREGSAGDFVTTDSQGAGFYLWGDEDSLGINGVRENSILRYRIYIPEDEIGPDGTNFQFRFRVARKGEQESDKQNDLWLNFTKEGTSTEIEDFLVTNGNEPEPTSQGFIKLFGGPNNATFGTAQNYDGLPGNPATVVRVTEAGFYEIEIAGRSEGFVVDYFELFKQGNAPATNAPDSPFTNDGGDPPPPPPPPPDPEPEPEPEPEPGEPADFTATASAADDIEIGSSVQSPDLETDKTVVIRFDVPAGIAGVSEVDTAFLSFVSDRNQSGSSTLTFAAKDTTAKVGFEDQLGGAVGSVSVQINEAWSDGETIENRVDIAPVLNALIASQGPLGAGDTINLVVTGAGATRYIVQGTAELAVSSAEDALNTPPTALREQISHRLAADNPDAVIVMPHPDSLFDDADLASGDTLSFAMSGLPTGLIFDPAAFTISGRALEAGAFTPTLTATDAAGASASLTVALEAVEPANWTPQPLRVGLGHRMAADNPDALIVLPRPDALFRDQDAPEGDTLSFSLQGLPDGLSFDEAAFTIGGAARVAGVFTLSLVATDQQGASSAIPVELTIVEPTNWAPEALVAELGFRLAENNPNAEVVMPSAEELFADRDLANGDALAYEMTGLPNGLEFDPDTFTFGGAATESGVFAAALVATDQSGRSAEIPVAVTVVPQPASAAASAAFTPAGDRFDFMNVAVVAPQGLSVDPTGPLHAEAFGVAERPASSLRQASPAEIALDDDWTAPYAHDIEPPDQLLF